MKRGLWLVLAVLAAGCGDDDLTFDLDAQATCVDDGQCDDGVFCNGVERCTPDGEGANAFGCAVGVPACLEGQRCEEREERCDTICEMETDADGDGSDAVACGGDDCDDSDPNAYPGNTEVCDLIGHDEDCDPRTTGGTDRDRDGFVDLRCCNGDRCGDDCDDVDRGAHPLSTEACNGVDDDCDGDVDEDVSVAGFIDADGDGYGDGETVGCPGRGGFALAGGDCDDGNPDVHPESFEVADGVDDDCDGINDESARPGTWYVDVDGDGYGDPRVDPVSSMTRPIGDFTRNSLDCDDAADAVNPRAAEVCNGVDDNCDGALGADEDRDRDGALSLACGGDDCDDLDPFALVGSPELCDGRDNDCDGTIDEDATPAPFYVDADGDGYGFGVAREMCAPAGAFVPRDGDCDDTNPAIYPGAPERCDGVLQDCAAERADVGARCALPFADAACVGGVCEVVSCRGARGDCDPGRAGCETDLTGSASACGGCRNACDPGVTCSGGVCEGESATTDWYTGILLNHYWVDPAVGMYRGGEVFVFARGELSLTTDLVPGMREETLTIRGPGPPPVGDVFLDFKPNRPGLPAVDFRWVTVNVIDETTASGYIPFYLRHEELAQIETMAREAPNRFMGMVAMVMPHNVRDGLVVDWDSASIAEGAMGGAVTLTPHDTEIHVFVNVPLGFITPTPPDDYRIQRGALVSAEGKVTFLSLTPL